MKSILAFISLLMQVWAVAQLPISFKNTSLIQGLSQSSVVDIAFDEKGFVWLATQDGLNRFDGKDFFVVDKKFDDNTSGSFARLGKVVIGNHPNVWIISKGGQLEKFNLIHHSFEKVAIYVGNARQNITCLLAEENGMLWIGTENGKLLFFDSKSNNVVRELTLSGSAFTTINSLFKDRQHRIWVIGNKVGFIQNNEIVFEKIFSKSLKPEMLFADMTEDNSGNVWLGSLGQGLFVKRGAGAFQQYESGSNDLVIEDLLADDEGKIWIGTYGKGLFVIDPIQNSSRQFLHDKKNPFSLPFNDVLSIKQDKEKGIWIGTDGGGVSYYHKRQNNFMLFSNQTVPYSIEIAMVRSVTTDKQGVIWAGTSNKGLTKLDYERGEFKTWQFPSYKKNITNPGRIVSLLADNKGLIWCGTQGNGVLLFSPQIETVVEWFHPEAKGNYAIPDPIAWCIYATSEKEIWIGTESKGLCLIDREK
ncbi:MAG TPA: two-component regulator propeller domain-containing protein, partial [Flavisolibacter sp.]